MLQPGSSLLLQKILKKKDLFHLSHTQPEPDIYLIMGWCLVQVGVQKGSLFPEEMRGWCLKYVRTLPPRGLHFLMELLHTPAPPP